MMKQYLLYLSKTLGCSRVKCRMATQSVSFFFRNVLKNAYVIPSVIYPRPTGMLISVLRQALNVGCNFSLTMPKSLILILFASISNCLFGQTNYKGYMDKYPIELVAYIY